MVEGRLFVVLWELWLHCIEIIFKGRAMLVDYVVPVMAGYVTWWFRRV